MLKNLIVVAVVTLSGCASDTDVSCTVAGGDSQATATIDGSEWAADGGSWAVAGSAIQINLESAVKLVVTLRGSRDEFGDDVADLVIDREFPLDIDLGGADGHGGVQDLRNGLDGYASNQPGGSGSMTIADQDGDTLFACFEFVAINNEGVMMEVRDGKVMIDQ